MCRIASTDNRHGPHLKKLASKVRHKAPVALGEAGRKAGLKEDPDRAVRRLGSIRTVERGGSPRRENGVRALKNRIHSSEGGGASA